MKICVYTVLIGHGKQLTEQPVAAGSEIPFICFSDIPSLESDSWQVRSVTPVFGADAMRSQAFLKLQPHRLLPEFDLSLYIDNTVVLTERPEEIFERMMPASGLGIFRQRGRRIVLDEFLAAIRGGQDDPIRLFEQLQYYLSEFSKGLLERPYWTEIIICQHKNLEVAAVLDVWQAHVMRFSRRDELSANLMFRMTGFSPNVHEIDIHESWFHSWGQTQDQGLVAGSSPNADVTFHSSSGMQAAILELVGQVGKARSMSTQLQENVNHLTAQAEEFEAREAENEDLRLQRDRLVDLVQAAEQWQGFWLRRVFFRWHSHHDGERRGFLKRLGRSFRKRFGGLPVSEAEAKVSVIYLPDLPVPSVKNLPVESPPPDGGQILMDMIRLRHKMKLQEFLDGDGYLDMARSSSPKVSILIVLFNNAEFTYSCLRALESETDIPSEVIVVDNHSTDGTGELLERVRGVEMIRNQESLGFLKAVDQAAARARGEHILLLNNDAIPRQGSLVHALDALERSEDIAAVGGRLVLPDGTLLEAGGFIGVDGCCHRYGHGLTEDSYEGMFRREVDFCSAAFLLLRRSAFESIGGFDGSFAPANHVEWDLCLRFYEQGHRVIYEPQAVVDSYEFASTDNLPATVAQLEKNADRFRVKDRLSVSRYGEATPESIFHARSRAIPKGRILFLDDFLPHLTNGAGCPRALEMLNVLHRAGFFVTFWALNASSETWESTYKALPREIEVVRGRRAEKLRDFLQERMGFYTAIIVSRPHNMKTVRALMESAPHLFSDVRIIYDAEAVVAERRVKKAKLFGVPLEGEIAELQIQNEVHLASDADVISVTSRKEMEYFTRSGFRNVQRVTHCIPLRPDPTEFAHRAGFLFVGRLLENGSPNADSIRWFVLKVLPIIRRELGEEIVVNIVGANDGFCLRDFGDASLRFLGKRDDISEFYGTARVFIAPTRFAAGIPLKVLEAAGLGVPVVATQFLADQLEWSPGEHLLASDDPRDFARECIRLHTEENLWRKIRDNALAKMASDHSPEEFSRSVISLIEGSNAGKLMASGDDVPIQDDSGANSR
jgi:GT2 family glycosyltransferase